MYPRWIPNVPSTFCAWLLSSTGLAPVPCVPCSEVRRPEAGGTGSRSSRRRLPPRQTSRACIFQVLRAPGRSGRVVVASLDARMPQATGAASMAEVSSIYRSIVHPPFLIYHQISVSLLFPSPSSTPLLLFLLLPPLPSLYSLHITRASSQLAYIPGPSSNSGWTTTPSADFRDWSRISVTLLPHEPQRGSQLGQRVASPFVGGTGRSVPVHNGIPAQLSLSLSSSYPFRLFRDIDAFCVVSRRPGLQTAAVLACP
ncbi:hypothetical protein GGS23DRAFT_438522 [Durotheca rogersii]|uniref:uncharacterized protein n=1 Tax=Durotheca rogersii TaxID=419775 RepID=UPI002220DCB8|nr:uncharacterized protein GGS23DRAFT_438522 [Durotheca rogersii]KAI5856154.1 hypothetical protein GGS23DRAFT_438522 [Durotheca rogersii]